MRLASACRPSGTRPVAGAASGRLPDATAQVDVRSRVALSLFTDFTDGCFSPAPHHQATLETLLDQVVRWAAELSPLRGGVATAGR